MNISLIEAIAPVGNEQVGRYRPSRLVTIASADVICEHFASRGMQRHEPILSKLGAEDRKYFNVFSSRCRQPIAASRPTRRVASSIRRCVNCAKIK